MCCKCGHTSTDGAGGKHYSLSRYLSLRHILFTHPLQQTLRNSIDVDPKHLNHPVSINIFVILSLTLASRPRGAQELRSPRWHLITPAAMALFQERISEHFMIKAEQGFLHHGMMEQPSPALLNLLSGWGSDAASLRPENSGGFWRVA